MKTLLKELLQRPEPIIADGGISTSLYDKGFYINRSFEELCVTEAQAVREVISGFKRAGAQLLHTNTFNAVAPKLITYGLQDQLEEILSAAVNICRDVAGEDGYVLGSVGTLGVLLEPLGPTSVAEAEDHFARNVSVFLREGVDGISFNGFNDLKELEAAIRATRKLTSLPIFAHIGIQESMKTSLGHTIAEFAELGEKHQVDVLGFCGEVGPSGMLTALQTLRPLTQRPIAVLPNAGLPRYVNDQYIYLCNPDYIGKFAKRYVQAGANIVGGHCGMGDQHIKAISNSIRMTQSLGAQAQSQVLPSAIRPVIDEPKKKKPLAERSRLGQSLTEKKRVFTVELVPPSGVDYNKFMNRCQELVDAGIEFVNIPDGARAVSRMSSLQLSAFVQNKFNLEPIPHFTTRDRNLIGLQSDLLGSYVNGVRNVLLVTGDPPKLGNCPGATAVYDVDAIGLTHIVSRMNQGLDLGGSSFGKPTEFVVGVAVNPTSKNRELEIKRFKYKIEAGADYAITQPIYSLEDYQRFMDELGPIDIPIVMGIWPLVSLRNAEFLKYEVPGVEVPDWVIEEMKKAGDDKTEAVKRGLEIAVKTMREAASMVAGFQVSAPFNKAEVAIDAIKGI